MSQKPQNQKVACNVPRDWISARGFTTAPKDACDWFNDTMGTDIGLQAVPSYQMCKGAYAIRVVTETTVLYFWELHAFMDWANNLDRAARHLRNAHRRGGRIDPDVVDVEGLMYDFTKKGDDTMDGPMVQIRMKDLTELLKAAQDLEMFTSVYRFIDLPDDKVERLRDAGETVAKFVDQINSNS